MLCRKLLILSVSVFVFLSFLTIGVIVYSQRERPREDLGTPYC